MADQKRWFKLWYSALSDEHLQRLPTSLRWAWASLGAYTKIHGNRGRVILSESNAVLCSYMGVTVGELKACILLLPHVRVEEGKPDNGEFTVTWENWHQYQEDSTVSERVARLRSKRRGEEKRKEKKKEPPIVPQGTLNGNEPRDILEWLNVKAGKHFRPDDTNLGLIRQRLKSGILPEQLKAIVSRKVRQWKGTDQEEYLRPATLFNKTKCSQYLGELPKVEENGVS